MKTYNPEIQVRLLKNTIRTYIADGKKINTSRYKDVKELDLRPFLGEHSVVETCKSVRQAAGTFSMRFPDQPYNGDSLYAFIEPMDLVEIRMSHDGTQDGNGHYPLIMRGFVSDVSRSEAVNDGKPQRWLTVTGHDFGKILQILPLLQVPDNVSGAKLPWDGVLMYSMYYLQASAKAMAADTFVEAIINNMVNPYIAGMFGAVKPKPTPTPKAAIGMVTVSTASATASSSATAKKPPVFPTAFTTDIVPLALVDVSVYAPMAVADVSLYQMLRTVLDVPMFNEMYCQDSEEAITLVVRPIPFKDLATGSPIQSVTIAAPTVIDDVDIGQLSVTRTDSGVANYFWVTTPFYLPELGQTLDTSALNYDAGKFDLTAYLNCNKTNVGVRKLQCASNLLPLDYRQEDAPKTATITDNTNTLNEWLETRREMLAKMNRDNAILEHGSLQLRGNEAIQPGTYLKLRRGVDPNADQTPSPPAQPAKSDSIGEVYAHTVSHKFTVYQGYTTTVTFDRGTMFYERVQADNSFYFRETLGVVGKDKVS